MRLAIIPARGGSKRVPRKNVRDFCGKPMIAWSVEAARASACFDKIIVSTDDEEIANIARRFGADVPFIRRAELADDHTPTIPVIANAIELLKKYGDDPEEVCCIYATAPFLQSSDLQLGLELLKGSGCDYSFSVTRYKAPIQRALRITGQGRVGMFNPEYFNTRSQDLEEAYHDAGQFYWGRTQAWLAGRPIFSSGTAVPVILPHYRVADIDTPEDWSRAELMFRAMDHEGNT